MEVDVTIATYRPMISSTDAQVVTLISAEDVLSSKLIY